MANALLSRFRDMETVELTRDRESSLLTPPERLHSPTSFTKETKCLPLKGRINLDGPSVGLKASETVPSRTLELHAISSSAAEAELLAKLKKEWQLASLERSHVDGCSTVRFYDIRDSVAAREYLESCALDGCQITATFTTKASARNFDEEGRIVVRVEEHLKLKELCHIFSTYGGVRNIQDLPNVNVHKVVEFYDVRDAQKATKALNGNGESALHAASVAYLEKTRCKLFLIPPRLPSQMEIPVDDVSSLKITNPKTLPLCGGRKQTLMPMMTEGLTTDASNRGTASTDLPFAARSVRALRDSSSSLASVAEQEKHEMKSAPYGLEKGLCSFLDEHNTRSVPQNHFTSFHHNEGSLNIDFANLNKNEAYGELSLEDVLPSGLGLYEDEPSRQEVNPSVSFSSAFSGLSELERQTHTLSKLPYSINSLSPMHSNNDVSSLSNQQLLSNALLSQLPTPAQMTTFQDNQEALLLAHYIEELQQTNLLQQLIQVEALRRWNSVKSNGGNGMLSQTNSMFPFHRPEELLKKGEKTNRKKNNRMNRRNSAMDLQAEVERRAQQEKMYALDLERVRAGQDKRTTLMIKNIPNKYTQRMLLSRIEQDFKGTFDFFYLPIDFKNKCNVGYGFINMMKQEYIVSFVEHVHEQKWDKFNSDKVCCVTYARIQGRSALINHFQNSSLMLEESKHQPLLFGPNGDPEPFPTKPVA